MSGIPTPKNSIANALKIYLFPSIVTVLAMMIWRDVTELRSDVKALLAQSNIDKTRIDNLQKDVQLLQQKIFNTPPKTTSYINNFQFDKYFKHEDVFDVKDYLPYKTS
jgi:hypothetical protein